MQTYDNYLHMMEAIGGSFIQALAALWYRADSVNKIRVEIAFQKEFDHYRGLYEIHVAERQKGGAA